MEYFNFLMNKECNFLYIRWLYLWVFLLLIENLVDELIYLVFSCTKPVKKGKIILTFTWNLFPTLCFSALWLSAGTHNLFSAIALYILTVCTYVYLFLYSCQVYTKHSVYLYLYKIDGSLIWTGCVGGREYTWEISFK